jgi:hypothetical protein
VSRPDPSLDATLGAALVAIQDAAASQGRAAGHHEDFARWGSALTELTGTLALVCRILDGQITHYGDERVLSDDAGGDPYERVGEMRRHLSALDMALTEASVQSQAYRDASGHLGVEVDPDATPG